MAPDALAKAASLLSFDGARLALTYICGVCAAFGVVYTVVAASLVGPFFTRRSPPCKRYPAVTVIKPLSGMESALLSNLRSFCEQDYPGDVQFLFGVHDARDPALEVVRELQRLYPAAHITTIANSALHGCNRKVSNLINMLPAAEHDLFVFADSDVTVASDYLSRVVGELHGEGVGLVTCAYVGVPDPGFWPQLSARAVDYQFLPGVVTALRAGLAQPCFGQTIAMRRKTLDTIGGLGQFAGLLAEDHAIGLAVRATGQKVVVPGFVIGHACPETTAGRLIEHELRWSRTIRRIDPVGHAGSALGYPVAWATLALVMGGAPVWAVAQLLVALGARALLQARIDTLLKRPVRNLWLLPLWDLFAFAILCLSFSSSHVVWRGVSFRVDGRGLLTVEPERPSADRTS
ncbi:bacteriohopanetetrol glucosamine biosynthesis glycosyltransferase HpnI [Paraburkholderia phymatum]|uniref:Putative (Ceramide) glucosyltransferase n=1 Tax=Paraburkholderia phymatum (strain DSM 17167 / CIP 108236 / LMG 21445 / STM815) TaxID=391038 RepID=B2JU29_PARP8|nr:bacteriohopanetetrol glucosamine biosynthesis glycosyltransferase HpnI [Paraburkholderia phymatum]ACC76082.1 putative (ceramide) glucosyltransferase [Paraburkholderia phymatum STM815]